MNLVATIKETTASAIEDIYKLPIFADDILVNQTKTEFEGDYTVVLFSFVKKFGTSPEKLGNEIGAWLIEQRRDLFTGFNVSSRTGKVKSISTVFDGILSCPVRAVPN